MRRHCLAEALEVTKELLRVLILFGPCPLRDEYERAGIETVAGPVLWGLNGPTAYATHELQSFLLEGARPTDRSSAASDKVGVGCARGAAGVTAKLIGCIR